MSPFSPLSNTLSSPFFCALLHCCLGSFCKGVILFFVVGRSSPKCDSDEGVALSDEGPGGDRRSLHMLLTEAGIARQSEFDEENSWIGRLEKPGMPAFMNSRNNFEFFDDGDKIRYEQGVFDVVRTIYLPESEGLEDPSHSPLGYSTGRMEGRTLIVETTRLNWPYFNLSLIHI